MITFKTDEVAVILLALRRDAAECRYRAATMQADTDELRAKMWRTIAEVEKIDKVIERIQGNLTVTELIQIARIA